jgi:membrane-bound metal-dependent hydrolase YbcI (DUF457 family)
MYFPSTYIIETYGIRPSICLGTALTTIGMWLSCIQNDTWIDIAAVFVGVAMPFILNTLTKMSATWFGPRGRNISTMLVLICFYAPELI